jgi:hypothetical protein
MKDGGGGGGGGGGRECFVVIDQGVFGMSSSLPILFVMTTARQ